MTRAIILFWPDSVGMNALFHELFRTLRFPEKSYCSVEHSGLLFLGET